MLVFNYEIFGWNQLIGGKPWLLSRDSMEMRSNGWRMFVSGGVAVYDSNRLLPRMIPSGNCAWWFIVTYLFSLFTGLQCVAPQTRQKSRFFAARHRFRKTQGPFRSNGFLSLSITRGVVRFEKGTHCNIMCQVASRRCCVAVSPTPALDGMEIARY